MRYLVTGGSGYIASHVIIDLISLGHNVVAIDNFCNSSPSTIKIIQSLSKDGVCFYEGDIRDEIFLYRLFSKYDFDSVIHFAGLKSVGDSALEPLRYYENNVCGSISLLKAMSKANVKKIVFSSSATVYGNAEKMPITESAPTGFANNPYGETKCIVERVLRDLCDSDSDWSASALRYFNPAGAHKSGLIGEDYRINKSNLFPMICRVALRYSDNLIVYGDDYETRDGTCVRDYIHISDLSSAHMKAAVLTQKSKGFFVYNIGTGVGYSVLEVIKSFEDINGVKIPFKIASKRSGDVPACYADSSLARRDLNWNAQLSLEDMVRDSWRWALNLSSSLK